MLEGDGIDERPAGRSGNSEGLPQPFVHGR
jgi:hypothetical protein